MLKKMNKVVLLVVVVFVLLGIFCFSTYNGLVSGYEGVRQAAADIQADLQRRSDLIPNLVSTVKGFATHEEAILSEIADARARLAGSGTMGEIAASDAELSTALSRLLVVVENYPELQSNQNFLDLQTQLEGTENRIRVSRTKYNEQVSAYNMRIRRFPGNLFAYILGFEHAEYFQASSGAQVVPEVSFD